MTKKGGRTEVNLVDDCGSAKRLTAPSLLNAFRKVVDPKPEHVVLPTREWITTLIGGGG